ncbi:MAG: DUF3151 family protein [Acidimicrobiales bacterium]
MADAHEISLSTAAPETVLPTPEPEVVDALAAARAAPPDQRQGAFAAIAVAHPRCLAAWAGLAEAADEVVERYAFARVGYHRGLDALRAAGWRGSGYVRWRHQPNRGFLGALESLRRAAEEIGEADEAERCALFLRQLDPDWPPAADG